MRLALLLAAVCATPLAAQHKPANRSKPVTSDSAVLVSLARERSPKPDSAHIQSVSINGDTARVMMRTGTLPQNLTFVRRSGTWHSVPTPLKDAGR